MLKTDQSFEIFKQNFLGPTIGDPQVIVYPGWHLTSENNLWISNFGAIQPLVVRKSDGNWKKFSIPFFLTENSLAQIIIDDNNYKWIVAAKRGGIDLF